MWFCTAKQTLPCSCVPLALPPRQHFRELPLLLGALGQQLLGCFSVVWGQLGIALEQAAALGGLRGTGGFQCSPVALCPPASALGDRSSLLSGFSLAACIFDFVQLPLPQIEINTKERVLFVTAWRSGSYQICHLHVWCLTASRKTKKCLWVGGCNVCCSASEGFKNSAYELPDRSSFRRQAVPGTF